MAFVGLLFEEGAVAAGLDAFFVGRVGEFIFHAAA